MPKKFLTLTLAFFVCSLNGLSQLEHFRSRHLIVTISTLD